MQTISSTRQSAILEEALHTPVDSISFELFFETIAYLRTRIAPAFSNVKSEIGKTVIDVSGSGGSGLAKFNLSTAAAFILASAGVKVVKFGNSSITGRSGSLNFLKALGVSTGHANFEEQLARTNLAILSAKECYPDLSLIEAERRALMRPSLFNFAGPLLNPVRPAYRLLGVSNSHMQGLVNRYLAEETSIRKAITVQSHSGLDELEPNKSNSVFQIKTGPLGNLISRLDLDTEMPCNLLSLEPSGAGENAEIFLAILDNRDCVSPHYWSLLLNAGAAFLAAEKVSTAKEGIALAQNVIATGLVKQKLEELRGEN